MENNNTDAEVIQFFCDNKEEWRKICIFNEDEFKKMLEVLPGLESRILEGGPDFATIMGGFRWRVVEAISASFPLRQHYL